MFPYKKEGLVAERPHLNLPPNSFEEELGLEGFFGPVCHIYHQNPPTNWSRLAASQFQWQPKEVAPEGFLRPQCYKSLSDSVSGDFYESQRLLFWNDDIAVHIHKLDKASSIYFRNADASEIFFCHEGSLVFESPFGFLQVEKADYVFVPKGVSYRWKTMGPAYLMRIESFSQRFTKPPTGIMGQQALYHEEGVQGPLFSADIDFEKESLVRVQKDGVLNEIAYDFDIRAVAGWCGTLYPFILSTKDIAPVMSSVAHLPPSINATFFTDNFIICSFLPRPLEEPEGALKVPFYHSNIDYDEVLFYHAGDFFSRDNMDAGYISLHPRGVPHGPHPKALKNQHKMKRTNETAVMIDTVNTLKVSAFARGLEIADYWKSWS